MFVGAILIYFLVVFLPIDQLCRENIRIGYQGEYWKPTSFLFLFFIAIILFFIISDMVPVIEGEGPEEFDRLKFSVKITILTIGLAVLEGVGLRTLIVKSGLVRKRD